VSDKDVLHVLNELEARWEWALPRAAAWARGRSFGPWAHHGCAGFPPYEDPGSLPERMCSECRFVWDLGQEMKDEEDA
jgi:hypothetical protein